jgi:DHA2 family multidrug resistance protein
MIGLPLLFIPINTVAYDGLPPDKTNQASSLINVARNLGGSLGVSLANAELVRRAQFHQARLAEHVFASSPVAQTTINQMTEQFVRQGFSPPDAKTHALGLIGRMIGNQATLMAYIDVFVVCAIFAALLVPLVLVLVRPIRSRSAARRPGGEPAHA